MISARHSRKDYSNPRAIIEHISDGNVVYSEVFSPKEIDLIFKDRPEFLSLESGSLDNCCMTWYLCDKIPGVWAYFYPVFEHNLFKGYSIYLSTPTSWVGKDGFNRWEVTGDNSRFHVMAWFEQIKVIAAKMGFYHIEPLNLMGDDDDDDNEEFVEQQISKLDSVIEDMLAGNDYSGLDKTVRIWWRHTDECESDGNLMIKSFINGWVYANIQAKVKVHDRQVYHMESNDDIHKQYLDVSYSTKEPKDFKLLMHALNEFVHHCGTEVELFNITEGDELPTDEYSDLMFYRVSGEDIHSQIESMSNI